MKTKFIPLLLTGLSLCLVAAPTRLRADAAAAPAATPPVTIGKKHLEINQFLDQHPKLKAKALALFDKNHNGVLDGDEIPAFLKWLKARREKRQELKGNGGQTTTTTPPAITSPNVTQ